MQWMLKDEQQLETVCDVEELTHIHKHILATLHACIVHNKQYRPT